MRSNRLALVQARGPRIVSAWPFVALALWLLLVGGAELAARSGLPAGTLCHFRRLTGIPCATCRGTRAAFALGKGNVAAAIQFNPLVTAMLVWLGIWSLLRFGFKRRLEIGLSLVERRLAWLLLSVAFAANWAYVILCE